MKGGSNCSTIGGSLEGGFRCVKMKRGTWSDTIAGESCKDESLESSAYVNTFIDDY